MKYVLLVLVLLVLSVLLIIVPNKNVYNISIFKILKNMSRKCVLMFKVSNMDVKVAQDNLFVFDDVMKSVGITYWLSEGTALGAIRNKGFIPGDDDVDTAMEYKYREKFINEALPLLEKNGFELSLTFYNKNFFGFMRNGEKLDVDILQKGSECVSCKTIHAKCKLCDEIFPYLKFQRIQFLGRTFLVPGEEYLEYLYGKDWRIPTKHKEIYF